MKHCLLFLLSFLALSVQAHNAGNICGTVTDAKTGIPIIGANPSTIPILMSKCMKIIAATQ